MTRGALQRLALVPLVLPVLAGLVATALPAFQNGGQGFRDLAAWPGLQRAATLSLTTGLTATLLSLTLALLIMAALPGTRLFTLLQASLAPLLAIPHTAAAIGVAFLIAPSGWIARALAPLTGWATPPDLLILNDPWGASLTLGLITKELSFLLIMALAALPQTDAPRRLTLARSMGYGNLAAFGLTVLPALYQSLRLPCIAVLTYAMTTVDMGLILGPTRPPSLAVQITLWMTDGAQTHTGLAAAAALLQIALTLMALAVWRLGEKTAATLCRSITFRGLRLRAADHLRPVIAALALTMTLTLAAAILALALWSVAGLWPFPGRLPDTLTLTGWAQVDPTLLTTTLTLALTSAALALTLTLVWLQAEYLTGADPLPAWIIYLPLIVPQVCFLPGFEHLALRMGATGGLISVTAAHLIFVLPYTYLALSGPFRAWDSRLATVAATMGASTARIFWRLRLPMLLAPVLTAAAIGVAVSVAQYLPTLLVGGGRVSTLTTEAVALASGGNRRLTSAYALLQSLIPMAGFALALTLPRMVRK